VAPAAAADDVLSLVPYFRSLRPDERVRVERALVITPLAPGQSFALDSASPRLVIVVDGSLELANETGGKGRLFPGDSLGDYEVVEGRGAAGLLTAREPATVATLDHASLEKLFEQLPILGVQFVAELGRELKWRNDLLREVCLARAEGLAEARLAGMLRRRRRTLRRQRQSSLRRLGAALWRLLVAEPARLPSFWMFAGAVLALVSARAVVAFIIQRGLQKTMFALIGGAAGRPIHIHHFNYGLLLVSLIGLISMLPRVRPYLRAMSFVFGFGLGLVVDEFALLWNLNPDYYQASSRLAAGLVLFALAQVVYFRAMYLSLWRRLAARWRR
jgi:CRP-like cAMP-binding protein